MDQGPPVTPCYLNHLFKTLPPNSALRSWGSGLPHEFGGHSPAHNRRGVPGQQDGREAGKAGSKCGDHLGEEGWPSAPLQDVDRKSGWGCPLACSCVLPEAGPCALSVALSQCGSGGHRESQLLLGRPCSVAELRGWQSVCSMGPWASCPGCRAGCQSHAWRWESGYACCSAASLVAPTGSGSHCIWET